MTTNADNGIKDLAESTCQRLASGQMLLDAGLVPLEDAAQALGIEPKRLVGFVLRDSVRDPIGGWLPDTGMAVYGWSCRHIAADTSDAVVGP